MTGGINDVDFVGTMMNGEIFGKDGDTAFFFKVVRVHNPLGDGFIGAVDSGMFKHGINQSGFTVVNVGNNGDVSDSFLHG